MKVEYTKTINIDLDHIATLFDDTLFDVLNAEYELDEDVIYQICPHIINELLEKVKERYKEEVK
jgi:hypothetical protein